MKNPSEFYEKELALYLQRMGVLKQAEKYALARGHNHNIEDARRSIFSAFSWSDTKEGYKFWWTVHHDPARPHVIKHRK